MPLDAKQIKFFIERIKSSEHGVFSSAVKQLFNYLRSEASENSEFIRYDTEPSSISRGRFGLAWSLPDDFGKAKSVCFKLYKTAAEESDEGFKLAFNLFKHTSVNENFSKFNEAFLEYFVKALEDIVAAEKQPFKHPEEGEIMRKSIFIIHGHDDWMKREVQLFLNRANLDDVVLHECPDKGRTIIDKLIEEGAGASYVVALLSPDDITTDGKFRARQNVILEIGYFLGRIGKEKVRLLIKGDLEIPSDLQGILYERFDTAGSWRINLLKEMKAVGIEVDIEEVLRKF